METFRGQRSPCAERFLGLFAAPRPSSATAEDELHEDDVLWLASEPSSYHAICPGSPGPAPPLVAGRFNPSPPLSALSGAGFRRLSLQGTGIVAALSEDRQNPQPFLYRKATVAASLALPNSEMPPVASARMIPAAISKSKLDYSLSMPAGKVCQQSAPVNVPAVPLKAKKGWEELEMDGGDEYDMLPPHEIVDRASGNGSPLITFSVLEGVGRTLKGRDLCRVRNTVLQKIGFLD